MISLGSWIPIEFTVLAGDPKTNFDLSNATGLFVANDQFRIEVIDLYVDTSSANSGPITVRIGFAGLPAGTLPAAAAAGVRGILFSKFKMAAGVRAPGIPGSSLRNQRLLLTCEDPAAGGLTINALARLVA